MKSAILSAVSLGTLALACQGPKETVLSNTEPLSYVIKTDSVPEDSDDPAIWIHPTDINKSLILGVDKDENGGLYVFDLDGKLDTTRMVKGLKRPNNVDLVYGLSFGDTTMDVALVAERKTGLMRLFSIPDLLPLDAGGIPVFEGQEMNEAMGIAAYKSPETGKYMLSWAARKDPRRLTSGNMN